MYSTIQAMADRIDRAILRSMIYSCAELEDYTQQFGARFNDDTGATRASIIAFVEGHDTTGKQERSVMIAESLRPGSGLKTIEAIEGDIAETGYTMVLTAGTEYTLWLETAFGGQYAFLQPSLHAYALTISYRTYRAIERVLARAGLDPLDD